MRKPRPITILKTAAVTAATAAGGNLGLQIAHGDISPYSIAFTALSVLLAGAALADDITTARRIGFRRAWKAHRAAVRYRRRHGSPTTWDSGECETYLDFTPPAPARRHRAA